MDNLFEQIANIQKASAYDIVSKELTKVRDENEKLKKRVKELEDLINEYGTKMIDNLTKVENEHT